MPEQLELFRLPGQPERITISEGFEILWKYHLGSKPSGRTYRSKRDAICRSMGNRYMDSVTFLDVERHKETRLRGSANFHPVSIGSVFHDHTLISLLFRKFREWKRRGVKLGEFDFSNIKLPDEIPTEGVKKKKAPKRERIVSRDEFSRLIEHSDQELADLLYFLIDTGTRLNDALKLKPANYGPTLDRITFTQSKTGKEQVLAPSKRVRKKFIETIQQGKEFVYDVVNLRARFEKAIKAAGLKGIQLGRDFRKTTYNVSRREFGADKAGQMLGHTSVRTGDDHYHVKEPEELRGVVKHLEKTFSA